MSHQRQLFADVLASDNNPLAETFEEEPTQAEPQWENNFYWSKQPTLPTQKRGTKRKAKDHLESEQPTKKKSKQCNIDELYSYGRKVIIVSL